MFHKILVPVDGSEISRHAMQQGVTLAQRCGASLIFLHVSQGRGERPAFFLWRYRSEAEARGIRAETTVSMGRVPHKIIEISREEKVDLIIMGTHGRKGVKRAIWGSVAESVARLAPSPVLVIRRHSECNPSRMLIPVDGSEISLAAAEDGFTLAKQMHSSVTVLYVVQGTPQYLSTLHEFPADPIEHAHSLDLALHREGQQILERIGRSARIKGINIQTRIEEGVVVNEIARVALEDGTGLIVMGTHGRRGLSRLVLGSVAESTARSAPCPVLLIRPEGAIRQETDLPLADMGA